MQVVLALAATILSFVALTFYGVAILAGYTIAATANDEVCCSLGNAESVLLWSLLGGIIASIIGGALWFVFIFRQAAQDNEKDMPHTDNESGA